MNKKEKKKLERTTNFLVNLASFGMLSVPWLTKWNIALKVFLTCVYLIAWALLIDSYMKNKRDEK